VAVASRPVVRKLRESKPAQQSESAA
jgi:hypothetical protein